MNNFEINLYHIPNNAKIGNLSLLSGYLYISINDIQKIFYCKISFAYN